MLRVLRGFLFAISVIWSLSGVAHTLSLVPTTGTLAAGTTLRVDLIAGDLDASAPGNIVSGYDLDLSFDASLLSFLGGTFSSALGDESDFLADIGTGNPFNVFAVSFLPDAEMLARQTSSTITLASFRFVGLAPGVASIGLSVNSLSSGLDPEANDPVAKLETDVLASGTQVIITPRTVSEPASVVLLGLSLVLVFAGRRRAYRSF